MSYAHLGRFVFRTPLLPAATFTRWVDEARAASGAGTMVDRLRARLAELVADPAVAEAIYVASPGLFSSIDQWRREPDSARGQRTERALVRYLARMSTRATPFGLFAGLSVGTIGGRTDLALAARSDYRRATTLDHGLLELVAGAVEGQPSFRATSRYRTNDSLYEAGGRFLYAEARSHDGASKSHDLVAVRATPALNDVVTAARGAGAVAAELARLLVEAHGVERPAAEAFVGQLIDAQILVPVARPPITATDPLASYAGQLRQVDGLAPIADDLDAVRAAMAELDRGGVGNDPAGYRAVVETLPETVELSDSQQIYQVDMVKPAADATLADEIVSEVERGIELLARLSAPPRTGDLRDFAARFVDRYGARAVPLAEALDEETGIGFSKMTRENRDPSPLLDGLVRTSRPGREAPPMSRTARYLMRRLVGVLAAGESQLELTEEDLGALSQPRAVSLPDAMSAVVQVVGGDSDRPQVYLRTAHGPSGARMLGRFCHAASEIDELVRDHIRAEEALRDDAIHAEIVHLPQDRAGNVVARPVLRDYEIPYLGASGAPADRQIALTDLSISVTAGRIVLWSERLQREVIPRLTSAHNYAQLTLPVYRFLSLLQNQREHGVKWSWGPLTSLPRLPRVTCGRLILERARWNLGPGELSEMTAPLERLTKRATPAEIAAARDQLVAGAGALRTAHRLPRFVAVAELDNELVVDFENPLSVDSFARLAKGRAGVILYELLDDGSPGTARGPEGGFVHEIVLPIHRERPTKRAIPVRPQPAAPGVTRHFPPGSDWLFAKLYTSPAGADALLREVALPLCRQLRAAGAIDDWHFLRYGDPEWHLRLRMRGQPAQLMSAALPALRAAVEPRLQNGTVWRFQLDGYDRELERYGHRTIELAERLFGVDSEAAAELVAARLTDGTDLRWQLTLRGIDRLLDDLGLELPAKRDLVDGLRLSFEREFAVGTDYRRRVGARYREQRAAIDGALAPEPTDSVALAAGARVLAERSARLAPIASELRAAEREGRLEHPLTELARSFVHMHVNRMARDAARAHELVLYELLRRRYESLMARARSRG